MPVFCNCETYEGAEKQRKYYKKDLKFQTIYGKIKVNSVPSFNLLFTLISPP